MAVSGGAIQALDQGQEREAPHEQGDGSRRIASMRGKQSNRQTGLSAMVLWQAYIDESGNRDSPVFVMGGFVASTDKWLRFCDDWQRMLEMPMRLAYFKMNEAATLSGEFSHWSVQRRDERVCRAYSIVEELVDLQLSCVIQLKHFDRLMRRIPEGLSSHNPYIVGLSTLVTGITKHQERLGISERIDFIFDEQVMEQQHIRDGWDLAKELFEPDVKALLGKTPEFRDDEKVLPLQAADFLAWWVRSMATKDIAGVEPKYLPPWKPKRQIPGIQVHYDEASLKQAIERTNRKLGFNFS
jgi:hypothetical protein